MFRFYKNQKTQLLHSSDFPFFMLYSNWAITSCLLIINYLYTFEPFPYMFLRFFIVGPWRYANLVPWLTNVACCSTMVTEADWYHYEMICPLLIWVIICKPLLVVGEAPWTYFVLIFSFFASKRAETSAFFWNLIFFDILWYQRHFIRMSTLQISIYFSNHQLTYNNHRSALLFLVATSLKQKDMDIMHCTHDEVVNLYTKGLFGWVLDF